MGATDGGFGYVAVTTLEGKDGDFEELEGAVADMLSLPGLLVDLRRNNGGDERRALRIAGLPARETIVYARSLVRSGPRHADLTEGRARYLELAPGGGYDGPIVVLIGPGCISSGEAFAMMLKALPNARLVGLPTRGASGNPAAVTLPNGVTVYYSRWISLLPDGTPIELTGVQPDIRVENTGPGDPTFHRGLEELRKIQ